MNEFGYFQKNAINSTYMMFLYTCCTLNLFYLSTFAIQRSLRCRVEFSRRHWPAGGRRHRLGRLNLFDHANAKTPFRRSATPAVQASLISKEHVDADIYVFEWAACSAVSSTRPPQFHKNDDLGYCNFADLHCMEIGGGSSLWMH